MGGCAGKNKRKSQDQQIELKPCSTTDKNISTSNGEHSDQFHEANEVIDQILSSTILSAIDTEFEFELANLIYGHPERDYAENPPIAKTFKSTEV